MALLPQKGDSGFTLGGFLILAALGTFLWKGAPLESVRPSSEQGGWYEHQLAQQVPARLWQDPFKAVYAHEQAIKAGTSSLAYEKDPRLQLIEDLQAKDGSAETSLLMVMVSPGSYAELEERRRRRRYAVLSGLGEENFVPRNPEILNVFYRPNTNSPKVDCFPENASKKPDIASKDCYSVPFEWFDYEDPSGKTIEQRQVLVVWLNESQFIDSPLKGIKYFLADLLSGLNLNTQTLRATLLGPGRSDALRKLATEKDDEAFEWLRDDSGLSEFNIISSTATVADDDLIGEWSSQVIPKAPTASPLIKRYQEFSGEDCANTDSSSPSNKTCMRFLRTIQNDETLIEKLAAELKGNRLVSAEKDYVVVISEWDTYFGRFLPRAFTKHFCAPNCEKVLRFSYQRGMDGILAGGQNAAKASQNSSKSGASSPSIDVTNMRRPVGTAQFDYLRRLAAEIQKKDNELRLSTGHGVGAVVLLGSDVYDKLLILRALRPELPGALFATTDLDAQLLHPAEYKWARSLIIASTYDFRLSSQIPMTTMPFRDSYQTSVYLATRLAFNTKLMPGMASDCDRSGDLSQQDCKTVQQRIYEKIPAQLFEVGRQSLVRLSTNEPHYDSWNLVTTQSFAAPIALGLAALAVLGIIALHQLRPMAGRVVAVSSFILLLFALLGVGIILQGSAGEPLALLAGASIWPTEYIRLLSIVLALVFIWIVIHRLHRNWCELGARYFWGGAETREDGITIRQLMLKLVKNIRHPLHVMKRIKIAHLLSLGMIVMMFMVMRIVFPMQLPLLSKLWLLIVVWIVLGALWWGTLYGHIWKRVRIKSVNQWGAVCKPKRATRMWLKYGSYGSCHQRFLRTIAYVIIYFTFASILFAILGAPTSPCRGEWACTVDKAIIGFSVLSMLVLLFLVVDAARLCICWVDSMRENTLNWHNSRKPEFVQRLRLPDTHAVAWIKIHLIGERTNEVTRLIYYPVLIILMLLLSRSTYFDNWDFPQALAIIIGLNFTIALSSIVRLNFVAQSVREEILRKLQDEKLAADREQDTSYEPSTSERQELIAQLESLRIGAYLRVWDQPPVRATLMLLGGVALTYAEYITVLLP